MSSAFTVWSVVNAEARRVVPHIVDKKEKQSKVLYYRSHFIVMYADVNISLKV